MKRIFGGKSIQLMINDLLKESPDLTLIEIVQKLGITIRDANIAIKQLLCDGVIKEMRKSDIDN